MYCKPAVIYCIWKKCSTVIRIAGATRRRSFSAPRRRGSSGGIPEAGGQRTGAGRRKRGGGGETRAWRGNAASRVEPARPRQPGRRTDRILSRLGARPPRSDDQKPPRLVRVAPAQLGRADAVFRAQGDRK